MSRRVSLLARVDQIVAKGDWSRERAQQRQAHHVHTRTSDKRGKRLLGTQATIEYYSHQLKKQDKAPTEEKATTASSKKEAAKKAVDTALKEATAAAEESEASKTSTKVRDGVGTRSWLLARHRWEVSVCGINNIFLRALPSSSFFFVYQSS